MELARYWDLIIVLTQKELKGRYKSFALGYLWSLGNPLAYGLLYYFVFNFVMKVKIENFPLFLVSALFPWQWLSNSLGVAWITYIGNAPLIKKMNFPRNLLPFAVSVQDMIHFLTTLPIVFTFMAIYKAPFTTSLIWGIPMLCGIQFLYTYSLGLMISSLNLFFRDLERLVGVFLMFLFYLTPIVYEPKMIPDEYQAILVLNPVAPLFMSWRNLFLTGVIEWDSLGVCLAYGLVFLVISHQVYKRLVWRFAEVL